MGWTRRLSNSERTTFTYESSVPLHARVQHCITNIFTKWLLVYSSIFNILMNYSLPDIPIWFHIFDQIQILLSWIMKYLALSLECGEACSESEAFVSPTHKWSPNLQCGYSWGWSLWEVNRIRSFKSGTCFSGMSGLRRRDTRESVLSLCCVRTSQERGVPTWRPGGGSSPGIRSTSTCEVLGFRVSRTVYCLRHWVQCFAKVSLWNKNRVGFQE